MWPLLRRLFRVPPPVVSREEAIWIATAKAQERSRAFSEGRFFDAQEGLRTWTLRLRPAFRPGYWIVVDAHSGEVLGVYNPPV